MASAPVFAAPGRWDQLNLRLKVSQPVLHVTPNEPFQDDFPLRHADRRVRLARATISRALDTAPVTKWSASETEAVAALLTMIAGRIAPQSEP